MDLWAYFRFTSLSVLLGVATFFFCYATWVWKRRQPMNAGSKSFSIQLVRTCSRTIAMLGIGLGLVTYIICEVVPIRGVMRLNQSFAARARIDTQVQSLAPKGSIKKGEVLARFVPGNMNSEMLGLQAQHKKLTAELEMTRAMPPEIDKELTRRHQNILSRIELLQATLNNLAPLLKETVRIGLEQKLEREDKIVVTDRYIIDYSATRNQSVSEYEMRFNEYERTSKLVAREAATSREFDLSKHQAVSSAEQIKKLDKAIDQFEREITELTQNNEEFSQLIQQQAESLISEINETKGNLKTASEELKLANIAIENDLDRAKRQKAAEAEMIIAEMEEVQAKISSLTDANTIYAPDDGVVVYRAGAPNSLEEQGVLVVMAQQRSAEVQFTLPTAYIDNLQRSESLEIWIENSVLTSRLTGRIADFGDSPFDSELSIVTAECQPPMDVIPMLASDQLVPVQLTWQPPLLSVPLFQSALGLFVLGGVGFILSLTVRPQREDQHDELPSSDNPGMPVTAAHKLGLHQGSLGATLQILGNQLRESILGGVVDADMIASVEWAIDRHQSRGIKMIRQGFFSTIAEGENIEHDIHLACENIDNPEIQNGLRRILKTLRVNSSMIAEEGTVLEESLSQ